MKTQLSLFEPSALASAEIKPPVTLWPSFLYERSRKHYFAYSQELQWQRNNITIRGQTIPVPRDESIFGEAGLSYQYRDIKLTAKLWPEFLVDVRDRIEALTGYQFDFVIGNYYKSGKDSIGYHADDSPEIGERPAIASLSLGATRKFKLRHKASGETFDYQLESGSLLVMHPGCQEEWVHSVPKTAKDGQRINWTFRPHVNSKRRAIA